MTPGALAPAAAGIIVRVDADAALAEGGRALYDEGDLRVSRDCYERAYQAAADPRTRAQAAIGLAGLWVREQRTVSDTALVAARLEQVLPLLEPDSALALRVRARLAGEADYSRGSHAAILSVLAEIRACDDAIALAEALSIAHHCVLGPDHTALRRELAGELTRVSFRTGRRGDFLMGLLWRTVDAFTEGDPHAGRLLAELRDQLKGGNHFAVAFVVSAIDVMIAIRAGSLDEAEALAVACARTGAEAGDRDSEWWCAAQLVTIRWYQGRLGELLPELRGWASSGVTLSDADNSAVAALAVAAAVAGDRRTAVSSLAVLCDGGLAALPRSSSWLVTMHGVVEAAFLLSDPAVAAAAYELLLPYAGLPMVGSLGVTCFGSAEQALGVAALTAGRLDAAIGHLSAAVQRNLALAHWPAVLASRRYLARALLERDAPGDAAAAERQRELAESEGSLPGAVAACVRDGRRWRVTAAGHRALLPDSVGMLHLAVLIANPRQEIHAAELVAGVAALGHAPAGAAGQQVLDREAIEEYTSRLAELDAELSSAASASATSASATSASAASASAASTAAAERDWLVAQLAAAAGLGGRVRAFPDQDERARIAAGKAIRRALDRISDADPVIGAHLRRSVRTGMRCSYWPS